MKKFIIKPSIDLYPGVRVTKETDIEFKNEKVHQTIRDLKMHSIIKTSGEGFESIHDVTVQLREGDILVFEENGRGYIKPVEPMQTVEEAMEDLKHIKDLG